MLVRLPTCAGWFASLLLAHLSQRLIWWAYRIGRPPLTVVRHMSSSMLFKHLSSETTGPIKVKFHMELLWDGGTKVCSNGPGHITKMAAMPIYGKNIKKSSSPELRPMALKLSMPHRVLEHYQVCSNDDPGFTLTYFTARSNMVLHIFVWEKGKTMDFSETIVVYDLKLATDDRSDKQFLLTSLLCPQGLYTCIISWKNCIKSDLKEISLKLATNV